MYDQEVKELLDRLEVFNKMYELIRFVDPLKKKVISYKNNKITELDTKCFNVWENNKICDNCISMRAYNENQSYVKIEYTPEKIYMVTSTPVDIGNKKLVLELMKDTTGSMFFSNEVNGTNVDIHKMIDNLNSLSYKDQLTGLFNRRYINEKLPIDLINAVLSKQSISMIMADIDHFKKVNDTYGHLTGDLVLKEFAGTISESTKRESDWVSRYGGEEFLICLPGADLEKAMEIAENIRQVVEGIEIHNGQQTIKITASFGVYSINPSEGDSVETLIEQTDQKLYVAKNNGRNRVEG